MALVSSKIHSAMRHVFAAALALSNPKKKTAIVSIDMSKIYC